MSKIDFAKETDMLLIILMCHIISSPLNILDGPQLKLKEWNMFQIFSYHLISICF